MLTDNCKHCKTLLIEGSTWKPYLVKRKEKICGKCRYVKKLKTKYYTKRKEKAVFIWAKDELESRLFRKFNDSYVSALRRNIIFSINKETFVRITKENCFYCEAVCTKQKPNGLDRIDSKLGYVESNVVSSCKYCNFSKNDQSTEEFLTRIKKIAKKFSKEDSNG